MKTWIEDLKNSNKLIIVEGKKDSEALKQNNINNVKELKRPLYKFIEEVSEKTKEVIILTDLDREGRKFYKILKHHLQKRGVKIDNKFREFLFKETRLTQIEGLKCYGQS